MSLFRCALYAEEWAYSLLGLGSAGDGHQASFTGSAGDAPQCVSDPLIPNRLVDQASKGG